MENHLHSPQMKAAKFFATMPLTGSLQASPKKPQGGPLVRLLESLAESNFKWNDPKKLNQTGFAEPFCDKNRRIM